MRYDVTVTFKEIVGGHPATMTFRGYYAETSWQAVMRIMVKSEVAQIRGDRLISISVGKSDG